MKRPMVVKRISDVIHHIAPKAQIVLYGSEARGDARSDSDIDLLILLEDNNERSLAERELEIARHLYEIELDTGIIISPHVVLRRLWEMRVTPFSINIQREGIAL